MKGSTVVPFLGCHVPGQDQCHDSMFAWVFTVWKLHSPDMVCLGSWTFSLNSLLSNTRPYCLTLMNFHFLNSSMTWLLTVILGEKGCLTFILSVPSQCAHVTGEIPRKQGNPHNKERMVSMKCEKYDHISAIQGECTFYSMDSSTNSRKPCLSY